jgi:hypothetical protein
MATVLRWLVAILRFVVLGGLLVVGLAVLYRYAPDRDQPKWSWVSWGSAATSASTSRSGGGSPLDSRASSRSRSPRSPASVIRAHNQQAARLTVGARAARAK